MSIRRKLAGHTFDCDTEIIDASTFVHELDAGIELVEDDGLVDVGGGDRADFDHALGDDAEVAFVAEDELVDVGA